MTYYPQQTGYMQRPGEMPGFAAADSNTAYYTSSNAGARGRTEGRKTVSFAPRNRY